MKVIDVVRWVEDKLLRNGSTAMILCAFWCYRLGFKPVSVMSKALFHKCSMPLLWTTIYRHASVLVLSTR